jgi:hypothetical protein
VTEVETNGHERREDAPRCVKCGQAWPCEGWLLEPPRLQPAPIPASPARDRRVEARRAADRIKAARALDRILSPVGLDLAMVGYDKGYAEGYTACELQQKSHYDVSDDLPDVPPCAERGADVGPEVITTTDRDHALHVQNRDPVSWCRQCVGPFFDV